RCDRRLRPARTQRRRLRRALRTPKSLAMHHPRQLSAAVLLAASSLGAAAQGHDSPTSLAMPAQIERIEPAFWWVGMKSDKLQLLVHGPRIADAAPQIDGASAGRVRIE